MPFSPKKLIELISPEERISLIIRRHWVVLAIKLLLFVLILALVLTAEAVLKSAYPELLAGWPNSALELIRITLLMIFFLGLLSAWTMYYLNVQIITNERLVDVNQRGLLHHDTSELSMDRVQDVTVEINGLLPNLLDYGTVYVQTAGEKDYFTFEYVPKPHQVARTIMELYQKGRAVESLASAEKKDLSTSN
jgi:uncharacterized membrane protein YdbT with pleckstrin-like domain